VVGGCGDPQQGGEQQRWGGERQEDEACRHGLRQLLAGTTDPAQDELLGAPAREGADDQDESRDSREGAKLVRPHAAGDDGEGQHLQEQADGHRGRHDAHAAGEG
jgi:hypothetical protein